MAKKLKRLAKGEADSQVAAAIRDSASQIWLAGLGAFSKAQEEGTKVFKGLVKEGEQIQARASKAASKAQQEGAKAFKALVKEGEQVQARAGKAAARTIADVRTKATGTLEQAAGSWGKLEKVFESRVAQALHSLNVPTKKDIDTLTRRVAELTAVTKKLAASMPQPEKATRVAAE